MKTCPICHGTGFHKGKICICIGKQNVPPRDTLDDQDVMDFLQSMIRGGKDVPEDRS